MITAQLALTTAAMFAGAAFYINYAEQPARMGLDDKSGLAEWKPSYANAFDMQATLAMVSGLLGLFTAWQTGDLRWLVGASLILVNWPYTLIAMMGTNNKLNAIAANDAGPASRALLTTWGNLHAVRTCLGVAAVAAYLWALS